MVKNEDRDRRIKGGGFEIYIMWDIRYRNRSLRLGFRINFILFVDTRNGFFLFLLWIFGCVAI